MLIIVVEVRDKNYSPLSHLVGTVGRQRQVFEVPKPPRTNTHPRRDVSPSGAVDTRIETRHTNSTHERLRLTVRLGARRES